MLSVAGELSFVEGNIIKYIARSEHKEDRLEDLKKARWYLDYLIESLENNRNDIDNDQ